MSRSVAPKSAISEEKHAMMASFMELWSRAGYSLGEFVDCAGWQVDHDTIERPQSRSGSVQDTGVLVLNKLFMEFRLLCKDLAEVVNLVDSLFATYDFATWREASEYRARHFRQEDDDWVSSVNSSSLRHVLSGR